MNLMIPTPRPFAWPWRIFWRLRSDEFAFALLAMVITAGLFVDPIPHMGGGSLTYYASLFLAPPVVALVYCIVGLYLPTSVVVFCVLQLRPRQSLEGYCTTNALTFALHAGPFFYFLSRGDMANPLWFLWASLVIFNYIRPRQLWRLEQQDVAARKSQKPQSSYQHAFDVV